MSTALQSMLRAGALIAAIAVIGAVAASAQTLRGATEQQGYIDPYAAYAYTPGLRVEQPLGLSGNAAA